MTSEESNMHDESRKMLEVKQRGGRLRVRKACDTCKKRKVKCNGNSPCLNCLKHGQDCHYNFSSARPQKYRQSFLKGRDSTANDANSNGSVLEDHMANLLLQLGSKLESSASSIDCNSDSSKDVAQATSTAEKSKKYDINRTHQTANNSASYNNRRSPWQIFSLDKYRFHRRYQNFLPYYLGASLLSEIPSHTIETYNLKQPRIQNYGWNMSGGHYLRHDDSYRIKTSPTDAIEIFNFDDPIHLSIVNKLLHYFFDEINPHLSIIHESMFWQLFNNGFLQQGKQKNSKAKLFLSMLYLILAITLRFEEGFLQETQIPKVYSLTQEELIVLNEVQREEPMFKYAYSIITKLTFEWESFELIQSWLLISFYMRTCYRQTACWNALGQAINMCNGMSLYLNSFPRSHSKYDESRAWHCFWACFIMDKLITFQMGRFHQLGLPVAHMTTPGNWKKNKVNTEKLGQMDNETENGDGNEANDEDDWFHEETIQLFHLSLIIMKCQKRDAQELNLDESLAIRAQLNDWFTTYVKSTEVEQKWTKLYQVQPLLSYLDVRLTFETRRLFLLINQPLGTDEMIFPLDTVALIKNCQLSIELMTKIREKHLFFVPWWLNLSQLFTVSVICITLIHSGLQTGLASKFLGQCMDIWNNLTQSKPNNPPGMLAECLWCLRMLNHMCCMRLISSATHLEMLVGTNPGDSSPNKNKFSQFGKIGEDDEESGESVEEEEDDEKSTSHNDEEKDIMGVNNDEGVSHSNLHMQPSQENSYLVPNSGTTSPLKTSSNRINPLPSVLIDGNLTSDGKDSSDLIDESLFSYLQWFDQNFI